MAGSGQKACHWMSREGRRGLGKWNGHDVKHMTQGGLVVHHLTDFQSSCTPPEGIPWQPTWNTIQADDIQEVWVTAVCALPTSNLAELLARKGSPKHVLVNVLPVGLSPHGKEGRKIYFPIACKQ